MTTYATDAPPGYRRRCQEHISAPPGAGRRCHWHIYLLIHNRMPLQDIGDDTNFSLKAQLFYFRELSELYFALSAKMLIILKVKARIYIPFQRLSVKFKCFDYKLIFNVYKYMSTIVQYNIVLCSPNLSYELWYSSRGSMLLFIINCKRNKKQMIKNCTNCMY